MIEIKTAFEEIILNRSNILIVKKGYEQGMYVLYINNEIVPFNNKKQRQEAYDLILSQPS